MNYAEIAKINVNEHTEKKVNLTYLSWAWAVDQLLRIDPQANWVYTEPKQYGETMMVFCAVTAFGKTMTAHLPVMDHRNKAIPSPDAFQVNVAMQRALCKAIALHGLGLYIYAGEDLPVPDEEPAGKGMSEGEIADYISAMGAAADLPELQKAFGTAYKAAEAARDKKAMGTLIRSKDARKVRISTSRLSNARFHASFSFIFLG